MPSRYVRPAWGVYGGAAALVDGEGRAEFLGVVFCQPAEAVASAVLFVRAGAEDEAVFKLDAVAYQEAHCVELGREQALAVGCAAPVDAPVGDGCAEWREAPLFFFFHGNDVGVGHEHQGRRQGCFPRCER